MTRLEGYFRLMIDGDWVAWTGTIIVFLLLSPVLIAQGLRIKLCPIVGGW